MFGFLKPTGRISEWRQSYARVCQTQRRMFGLTSLPFLSYEATFLYQLAVDTKLIPALSSDAPECCRLRRLQNPEQQPDVAVAEFRVGAIGGEGQCSAVRREPGIAGCTALKHSPVFEEENSFAQNMEIGYLRAKVEHAAGFSKWS